MEPNKTYNQLIYFLFNVFKSEKTRTKILLDSFFEEKILILINDLLLLEKDYDCLFKEETWFTEFAKNLANILQKKLKFEKPDNKKIEDVENDLCSTKKHISEEYKMEVAELELTDFVPLKNDLKNYKVVTSEMLNQYQDKKPQVEVVGSSSAGSQQQNFQGRQQFNQQGFDNNQQQFTNPFTDDRFYPFRTKQKHNILFRRILAAGIILVAIFLLATSIMEFMIPKMSFTVNDLIAAILASDSTLNRNDVEGLLVPNRKDTTITYTIIQSGTSNYLSIIFFLIYVGILVYFAYKLIKPATSYREKYSTSYWIYVIVLFANIMIAAQFYSLVRIIGMSKNDYLNNFITAITTKGQIFDYTSGLENKFETLVTSINNNKSLLGSSFFFTKVLTNSVFDKISALGYLVLVFFIIDFATLIFNIYVWVVNPRIDRDKFMKLQMEMQKKMSAQMQGQDYQMDPSLFVPENEYNEVMAELNKNKKEKDRDSKN